MKGRILFLIILFYIVSGIVLAIEVYNIIENEILLWSIYGWMIVGIVLLEIALSGIVKTEQKLKKVENEFDKKEREIYKLKQQLKVAEQSEETEIIDDNLNVDFDKLKGSNEREYFKNLLNVLAESLNIVQGIVFKKENEIYKVLATYAYYYEDEDEIDFKEGEGINGQVALDKKLLILSDVPKGYAKVYSGLGESYPKYIGLWPIVFDGDTKYMIEFATFEEINDKKIEILKQLENIVTKKEF
jgi:hypothetical protein